MPAIRIEDDPETFVGGMAGLVREERRLARYPFCGVKLLSPGDVLVAFGTMCSLFIVLQRFYKELRSHKKEHGSEHG
jgi:hypothetical protein